MVKNRSFPEDLITSYVVNIYVRKGAEEPSGDVVPVRPFSESTQVFPFVSMDKESLR